jgi:hypothetical protein
MNHLSLEKNSDEDAGNGRCCGCCREKREVAMLVDLEKPETLVDLEIQRADNHTVLSIIFSSNQVKMNGRDEKERRAGMQEDPMNDDDDDDDGRTDE